MRRILIIDDDRMVRREVNRALSKEDYEVIEAPEPTQGLQLAKSEQPDLVLLDVLMPGMDGITVLRHLRNNEATRGIPVIMVTSLGSEDQVAACLEEGACDHVTKPFSHRLLCARVAAALLKERMSAFAEERDSSAGGGQVIAFLGVKGGVGATTLAANAATAAAECGGSVILCELRPTFGTLSLQLNAQPGEHLGTLTSAMSELTHLAWDCYLISDSTGLRILFGPQSEDRDIRLDADGAARILDALRPLASTIFLDLEAGLTKLNREILKCCNRVVLVSDCEPTSVAATKLIADQLQQRALRHSIKAVIVRRTEIVQGPKIDEIRSALGCNLIGVIPPSADAIAHAAKAGATLVTLRPDDVAAASIRQLTEEQWLARRPAPVPIG